MKESIIPSLEKLKDDSDADVRYFAGKALEVCFSRRLTMHYNLLNLSDHDHSSFPSRQIAAPIAEGRPAPPRDGGVQDQEMADA